MIYSYLFILLTLFIGKPPDSPPKYKANRAYEYHYQAKVMACCEKEYKKAFRLNKKALNIKRDPAFVQFHEELKSQLQIIEKDSYTTSDIHNLYPQLRISVFTTEASIFASQNDFGRCHKYLQNAKCLSERLYPNDSNLLSVVYNNYGCGVMFNQSTSCKGNSDHQHLTIHVSDMNKARYFFSRSIDYWKENMIAAENLSYINTILSEIDYSDIPHKKYNHSCFKKKQEEKTAGLPDKYSDTTCYQGVTLNYDIRAIVDSINNHDELIYVLDFSGSMTEYISGTKTPRYKAVQDIVCYISCKLNPEIRVGCITVDGDECYSPPLLSVVAGAINRSSLCEQVKSLYPVGTTPLNTRLQEAAGLFRSEKNKAILLCSDGLDVCSNISTCEIKNQLKEQDIDIYILAFLVAEKNNFEERSIYDCLGDITYSISDSTVVADECDCSKNPVYIPQYLLPQTLEPYLCLNESHEGSYSAHCRVYYLPSKPLISYSQGYLLE